MHFNYLLLLLCFISVHLYGQVRPPVQTTISTGTSTNSSPENLLSQYVQFSSVSGDEEEAGLYFQDLCKSSGLHVRTFRGPDNSFNFTASLYPLELGKPNIIFLNHIDVVPAEEIDQWDYPPFSGKIIGQEVWGRGSFDNKGIAIMQFQAISQFIALAGTEDLPYNVTLLAVSCEETQCEGGAQYMATNFLKVLNPEAIIGEGPPSLEGVISSNPDQLVQGIATGSKRPYWLKLHLSLPSLGHGSITPLQYANKVMVKALEKLLSKNRKAIYTAENLAILRNLGDLEGGIRGFVLKKPRLFRPLLIPQLRKRPEIFALFSNTITLTNLSNPTTEHNTIPESVTCLLDCRLLPQTNEHKFLATVKKQLNHESIKIEVVQDHPQIQCSLPEHPIYGLLEASIREYYGKNMAVVPLLLPNFNDSGWFRVQGIPVFDCIPAKVPKEYLESIHGHNERMPIAALYDGIQVYTNFLGKLLTTAPIYVQKP